MDNKDKIIGVAFILSLKKGFSNVSIKEIQELSGLSAGTIYYHFKDKDEILEQMVKKYIINNTDEFKNAVKNSSDSFMDRIEFLLKYIPNSFNQKKVNSEYSDQVAEFNHRDYFELITSIYHQHPEIKPLYYELHDGLHEFYTELVQEAIEKGEIRDDVDIKTMTMFLQTLMKGYLDLWVFQPKFSSEELADANLKMLWDAVKKQ